MALEKTFQKVSLTLEAAEVMIEAAKQKANDLGIRISITIVDESGVDKAFTRMDEAPVMSIDNSRKKAVTAVGYGIPTGEKWYSLIKGDPILIHGTHNIKDFILLGGGIPVKIDDQIVGAIGISGGFYKQDDQCAQAAIIALEKNGL